jgi:hypothetical protein
MKSSSCSARLKRSPLGADSTGLVATVISARTWPSPGVSISSARQVMGNSPITSGAPADAGVAKRPVLTPRPLPGLPCGVAGKRGGLGKQGAARVSRWPVSDVDHIDQPAGCRAIGLGAGANAGVHRRPWRTCQLVGQLADGVSRHAAAGGHGLGGEGRHGGAYLVERPAPRVPLAPATPGCRQTGGAACQPAGTRRHPGRMKWCSSAMAAVSVRRGSITIRRPPRACIALALPLEVGHGPHAAVAGHGVGAQHQQPGPCG